MKTIKFRAWDKEKKEMISLADCTYLDLIITDEFQMKAKNDCVEIMQFTGLIDKNKKEIYEGDIIQIGSQKGVVIWLSNMYAFGVDWGVNKEEKKGDENHQVFFSIKMEKNGLEKFGNMEIIGNIYTKFTE